LRAAPRHLGNGQSSAGIAESVEKLVKAKESNPRPIR